MKNYFLSKEQFSRWKVSKKILFEKNSGSMVATLTQRAQTESGVSTLHGMAAMTFQGETNK